MTSKSPAQCFGCSHRTIGETALNSCDAFPDGIPLAIALGGFDHTKPFEGDRGIRFEQAPGGVAKQALADWRSTFA